MLRLEQVSKTYGEGTRALRDVSLTIEAGEFVVILGKSGAGKSTLLRCINRLVEPTSGKIFFENQEVTAMDGKRLRSLRQKIGMIFQDYNLVSRMSVQTNVLSGALGRTPAWAALVNYFGNDEIATAQHHLERLVNHYSDRNALVELEQLQNQFIRQKEVIDELKHEIHVQEDKQPH